MQKDRAELIVKPLVLQRDADVTSQRSYHIPDDVETILL
jgi:hypothetical protein